MKNSARNTLILVGRIGKDGEKVELENGKTVIKFSLATPNYYLSQDGEKVERVDWHDCEIWKNSEKAGIAEYLAKGTLVSLNAQLRYNSYTQTQGKKTTIVKRAVVAVENVDFLASPNGAKVEKQKKGDPLFLTDS
jgi:single-strand DNA-binding protein